MAIVEDLAPLFTDSAMLAVLTPALGGPAIEAAVLFDAAGADLGDVISMEPTVIVRRSLWPAVRVNDAVLTGGVNYKVRVVLPEDDGALLRVVLARA